MTKSWTGKDVCDYKGFTCDTPPKTRDRAIAGVDFNGLALSAPTVCGFADQLPDLAFFHANSNNFTHTVPDLTRLRYLFEFDISNNKLDGPFPSSVVHLRNVEYLDLRYNGFQGKLPHSIFHLDSTFLFLNNNPFNSPLPKNVGETKAQYLTLANNGFTGSIPSSIGKAADTLIEVILLNNRLSGCLPYEIGLLRKATLFDASRNRISGTIPLSFGCLESIEELSLASNLLYGTIPESVCELPKLLDLSLSDNYFTDLGPSCRKLIHKGILDVKDNCIPGLPNQKSHEKCESFLEKPPCCPIIPIIPCYSPPPPYYH